MIGQDVLCPLAVREICIKEFVDCLVEISQESCALLLDRFSEVFENIK